MTTTQAAGPTIRNAGTKPINPRKLFVNIPVADLQRSIDFFEALGFTFNRQFTDATATCMLVGEDAYFMLLTPEKFASFTSLPVANPRAAAYAGYSFNVGSRAEVDDLAERALQAGGSQAGEPQDHGFMYSRGFFDPDGHSWDVFWMDPAVVEG